MSQLANMSELYQMINIRKPFLKKSITNVHIFDVQNSVSENDQN